MKNVLKNFVHQMDAMNTISGGTIATSVNVKKTDQQIDILINAPTVPSEAFNIFVQGNQLIVYSTLKTDQEGWMTENETAASKHMVPMFNSVFDIPQNIAVDDIEAIFEKGRLKLILPIDQTTTPLKRINIREF